MNTTTRRRTFDENDDTPQRGAQPEGSGYRPCAFCGEAAPYATLSRYGARCAACYDQFLRLGYSGPERPPTLKQAAWVKGEAQRVREHMAAKGTPPNAFARLSERMRQQREQRRAHSGMSEDEVNGLLAGGGL